jgi:T5SS/PEP-CTERM-associated repeat protein
VVVSGPGSVLSNGSIVVIGFGGSFNQLLISNGAQVFNTGATLGSNSPASGNFAMVSGEGSLWKCSTHLRVGNGGSSSSNQLVIRDAGTVLSSNLSVGGSSGVENLVMLDGGNLFVSSPGGSSTSIVRRGRIVLNSGLMETDLLRMVNGTNGVFQLNGGKLSLRGSFISNTVPFVVGDGVSPATLQLAGSGVHEYFHGLRVAPNSHLVGSGTVFGNVTNLGTMVAGGAAGSLTINGDLDLSGGGELRFDLGVPGGTNRLVVAGTTTLGGALTVALTNGYYPASSAAFGMFEFASPTGIFTNVTSGMRLNTPDGLGSFLVTVTATNVVFSDYQSPDTDADGQTDYAEFLAGTDLNDPASVLRITMITINGASHAALRFPFVAGKSYRVYFTDDPAAVPWVAVNAPVFTEPVPGYYEWVDDGSLTGGLASGRSYRVGLE